MGGGAVFFSIDRPQMLINDRSPELFNLYHLLQQQDNNFFDYLQMINKHWRLLEEVIYNNRAELVNLYNIYAGGQFTDSQMKDALTAFILHHNEEFNGILSTSFNIDIENFIREVTRNLTSKTRRMKVIEQQRQKMPELDVLDNFESALKSAFYMHFRHLYNQSARYKIDTSFAIAIFYFLREFCFSGCFDTTQKGNSTFLMAASNTIVKTF